MELISEDFIFIAFVSSEARWQQVGFICSSALLILQMRIS
jgi:hypothetical protein